MILPETPGTQSESSLGGEGSQSAWQAVGELMFGQEEQEIVQSSLPGGKRVFRRRDLELAGVDRSRSVFASLERQAGERTL